MPHANDSHIKQQRDDLRRQLTDRLGRLVAREYLSRQNIGHTSVPPKSRRGSRLMASASGENAAGCADQKHAETKGN
jgi:hypothetical protein